jgi:hypothetical protein
VKKESNGGCVQTLAINEQSSKRNRDNYQKPGEYGKVIEQH